MSTWPAFTAIANGTQIFNHGYDQCVALANHYHEDVIGGEFVPVGSAYQWWTDYKTLPQINRLYKRSSKPVAGALFVARGGIYDLPNGHIGVVTEVRRGGFSTMEQNTGWAWPQRYVYRHFRANDSSVLGFLVPIDNPAQEDIVQQKDINAIANLVVKKMMAHPVKQTGKGRKGTMTLGKLLGSWHHQIGVTRRKVERTEAGVKKLTNPGK